MLAGLRLQGGIMDLKEKIAYLKGLIDGHAFDQGNREGQIFVSIAEIFQKLADEIDRLKRLHEEMEDYLESVDEDLNELEEIIYGDEEDLNLEDEEYLEIECTNCHDKVSFEPNAVMNEEDLMKVMCPHCGAGLFSYEEE
jgi:formylmethanofuran dehydrogenase subunit E